MTKEQKKRLEEIRNHEWGLRLLKDMEYQELMLTLIDEQAANYMELEAKLRGVRAELGLAKAEVERLKEEIQAWENSSDGVMADMEKVSLENQRLRKALVYYRDCDEPDDGQTAEEALEGKE